MLYPIFLGQLLRVVLTASSFIVVARLLEPASYGVYTFAMSFYMLLNGFLAFGVGAYVGYAIPELMRKKDKEGVLRAISGSYIIAIAVSGAFTLLGLCLSGYLSGTFSNIAVSPTVLMIASVTVVAYIASSMPVNVLIGFSKGGLSAALVVFIQVMQLLFSVVLTLWFGVAGAVAATLLACLVGLIPGAYLVYATVSEYCRPRILLPSWGELREILRFAWPVGVTNFLNNGMLYFSVIYIGLFVMTVTLGNYGAASTAYSLLALFLSGALGVSLLPVLSAVRELKPKGEVNTTYGRMLNIQLVLMLPLMAFTGVMAVPLLYLLVGASYLTAPLYFVLIVSGSSIFLFTNYVNSLLISEKHTFSIIKVNLVSAVLQLALILALIQYTKVIGMIVIIFFIGNIAETFLFAREARRHLSMRFDTRKILLLYSGALAFGLVLAGVYLATSHYLAAAPTLLNDAVELAVAIVVSVLIYPVIQIALGAVTKDDLDSMRLATSRLGRASQLFNSLFCYSGRICELLGRK